MRVALRPLATVEIEEYSKFLEDHRKKHDVIVEKMYILGDVICSFNL